MCFLHVARADDAQKPKVAVFPLGGTADQAMREKVGFSFRAKLDRQGTYEPIDGPTMADLVGDKLVNFDTPSGDITKLATTGGAVVDLWGELDGKTLKMHVLDTRDPQSPVRDFQKQIGEPTDLRFAVEQILETLPGIAPFEHPSEMSVTDDPAARALFAANPNLLTHGNFDGKDASDAWDVLLRAEKYHPPVSDAPPEIDKVAIVADPGGKGSVLAMNMSKDVAESNGLACISSAVPIQPQKRYRLQFRYKSDGPVLHVFVKGYGTVEGEDRQIYTRQVPPSEATKGKWVTITDDLNPQNGQFAVTTLKVDLYTYLKAGTVMFGDIVLKEVGTQTHITHDQAVKTSTK